MSKILPIAGVFAAVLLAAAPAQALVPNLFKGTDHTKGLGREVVSFFGFGSGQINNPTDPAPAARPDLKARAIEPETVLADVTMPAMPADMRDKPRVEHGLKKLFCVEYARMRSGLAVFGDAKHWWERARNLYARLSHPVEEAVMVFSGSARLRRGHVAVVTEIVSPREVIVDQANWQNRGEIDHATPVLDVSKANDWSLVRVWNVASNSYGVRTYAISGFIAKGLTR